MICKFIRATLLLLTVNCVVYAQNYRTLTTTDFQGQPRSSFYGAVAYTNCSISYNYTVKRINGVFKLNFNVDMVMNRNLSWIDHKRISSAEMLSEVLKHEQGHYIIAYLQQQEVIQAFNNTIFGRDYNLVARAIFDRIDAKYQQLNKDYEEDTNHMQNRIQQTSWDKYLNKCVMARQRTASLY